MAQVVAMGDHRCYVGEVLDMGRDHMAAPLIYYRGRFRGLGPAMAPAAWYSGELEEFTATW